LLVFGDENKILMKVICIDNSKPKTPDLLKPQHWIYEGETYTVSSSYLDKTDGFEYYHLLERMDIPNPAGYRSNRFLPLSSVEEESNGLQVFCGTLRLKH
jgi:hypothetical protein